MGEPVERRHAAKDMGAVRPKATGVAVSEAHGVPLKQRIRDVSHAHRGGR
jgi:hypothetical protein